MSETSPPKKRSKRSIAAKAAWAKRKGREVEEGASVPEPSVAPPSPEPTISPKPVYTQARVEIDEPRPNYAPEQAPTPGIELQELYRMQSELRLLEQQNKLMYGLPFLHGWKFYKWAREFYESRNKLNFLCAANQISKSSTQIRKVINWATNKDLWPQLWERPPSQFWYLYPSQEVVDIEFKLKWEREFLPRGEFKDDPVYGWREIKGAKGSTRGIAFNSGVYLFFKTYTKDVHHLQTGTCDAIFCDEELPMDLYDELMMRLNATDGYFHMVFTATMGQDYWRRCMEPEEHEEEVLPQAAKWTVSLYEAMFYEDGEASHWTAERIAAVRAKCKSHQEVQKRVYGRFIVLEGRKYPSFDATRHVKPKHPIPSSWLVYGGMDKGAGGGGDAHPSALAYVAVRPDFRAARVFLGWRGDNERTTDSDVIEKHLALTKEAKIQPTATYYDWSAKDLETVSIRMHVPLLKAEKGHELGEGILNTLFKNDMLFVYEDAELGKLVGELSTLKEKTLKKHAKDDFVDALRYAVSQVPWDFTGIIGQGQDYQETPEQKLSPEEAEILSRRRSFETDAEAEAQAQLDAEFEEFNSLAGT